MPETTFLHIRSRDSEPVRVVPLPGPTARGAPPAGFGVGVGPDGQVRLGEGPDSDDARCYLRRRGESWHIHPVGRPDDLSIDGRPVDRQRPLPLGVTFRVGEHWLTLRPAGAPAPEWDAVASQVNTRPVEPEADSPAVAAPPPAAAEARLRAEHDRLSRWQSRLEQREQWLKDRQGEKKWESRWKAAGAQIRAVEAARPAPAPPTPTPMPRVKAARPAPAVAPLLRPMPVAPLPPREVPAPSAGRIVARKLGEARRDVEPPPPPAESARAPEPTPSPAPAPAQSTAPAPVASRATPPTPAALPAADPAPAEGMAFIPGPLDGRRLSELLESLVSAGPGLNSTADELAFGSALARAYATPTRPADSTGDAAFVDEWVRKANRPGPPAEVAPAVARAPLALDPPEAPRALDLPAEVAPPPEVSKGEPPCTVAPGPEAPSGGAGWVLSPPPEPEAEPTRSDPTWPSARVILRSHEAAREAATRHPAPAGPARRGASPPTPTVARPPATVPIPRWLSWPVAAAATAALGIASVAASLLWVADDRAAAPVADALLGATPAAVSAADLEPPRTDWWATTADHMYLAAAANDRAEAVDPGRVTALLDAALAASPLHPAARLASARRAAAERPGAEPGRDLGLSRDATALAWTARRLIDAGKVEPALGAYRAALQIAATADLDRLGRPTFREDSDGKRYLLPHEDAFGPILREMAARPGWGDTPWHLAVPDHPVACVALARVLRESGKVEEADRALARAVDHGPGPAIVTPGSAAVALAARAEALAMLGRWEDAEAAYKLADRVLPARPGFDAIRRSWWFNRADIALRGPAGPDARQAALLMAKSTDPNDEISRRVLDVLRAEGVDRAGR